MKKILISILFLILLVLVTLFLFQVGKQDKVVLVLDKCVDGDTAWFYQGNARIKVRFLGIDTPESTNYVEEYGKEASNYTCEVLSNAKSIYLEYDMNSDRYDKYDRVLGWVFVDNNNLSKLLLSKGYAQVAYIYGDYFYIEELCQAQKEAYSNRLGIWNIYDKTSYENNYCQKKS